MISAMGHVNSVDLMLKYWACSVLWQHNTLAQGYKMSTINKASGYKMSTTSCTLPYGSKYTITIPLHD